MGRFKIVAADTAVAFYLKLNTKVPPTDDVHIRKRLRWRPTMTRSASSWCPAAN